MASPLGRMASQMEVHDESDLSWGLYTDRDRFDIPSRGLAVALNVRIRDNNLTNAGLGWVRFTAGNTPDTITGMAELFDRVGSRVLLVGTDKDLLEYDVSGDLLLYLTPRYQTGTAAATGTAVTGVGTLWNTADANREGQIAVQAGDMISFGAADARGLAGPWYEIDSVGSDTGLVLTTAVPAPIGAGPYTIRQRFGGLLGLPWYFEMFPDAQGTLATPANGGSRAAGDDIAYASNGSAILSFQIGEDEAARLDLGHSAKVLLIHKNKMLHGNLVVAGTSFPANMRSSVDTEPENFSGTGAAEIAVVTSPTQEIVGMRELGDTVAIYCRTFDNQRGALIQLQEVEIPIIWALRVVSPSVACVSGRAIVDLGNFHEFLGIDGAYAYDGVQIIEHASHALKDRIRDLDGSRLDQAIAFHDYENGEINWIMPRDSDAGTIPSLAMLEHYRERHGNQHPVPFTERDLPATATCYFTQTEALAFDDFSEDFDEVSLLWSSRSGGSGFPALLFARETEIQQLGDYNTQRNPLFGLDIPYGSRATTNFRPAIRRSAGLLKGLIHSVIPQVANAGGNDGSIRIVVLNREEKLGEVSGVSSQLFPLDLSQRFLSIRKLSRYYALSFRSQSSYPNAVVWWLKGYTVRIAQAGER